MSIEFLLTSLIVVAIPGTGAIYTVSTAIGGGYRSGLFAAIGCTLGIVPHIVAAMLGLSGIMQIGAGVFEVVRWAGVAYLVLMEISMIRDRAACTWPASRPHPPARACSSVAASCSTCSTPS